MRNVMITLPASVKWRDYKQELLAVAAGQDVLNFRVPHLPKESGVGAKCFLAHQGHVVGYMLISGLVHRPAFTCSTTGNYWPAGNYIQRTGAFHALDELVPQKGFQSWRYTDLD